MRPLERFGIQLSKEKFQEGAVYGIAGVYLTLEKEISEYMRVFNLTPAKFNAMMIIKHKGAGKGLSQIEIGKSLIVSASNMTRLLDRLHKEGFIERASQEGDRRVNIVKITRKGSDILDKAWPGYYKLITEKASLLDAADLKKLAGLLLRWFQGLEGRQEGL